MVRSTGAKCPGTDSSQVPVRRPPRRTMVAQSAQHRKEEEGKLGTAIPKATGTWGAPQHTATDQGSLSKKSQLSLQGRVRRGDDARTSKPSNQPVSQALSEIRSKGGSETNESAVEIVVCRRTVSGFAWASEHEACSCGESSDPEPEMVQPVRSGSREP
jgi:hypothetical protein